MRVNGKNYKSIVFTVLKDQLLIRRKKQTMRMQYIPSFIEGEKVALAFKENGEKEFLYFVEIKKIYPKKLREITEVEAIHDGFNTIEECQACLIKLNSKKLDNFLFVIQWEPLGE